MRGECVPAVTMVSIVWLKGLVPSPHPLFHPPIVSPDCSGSPAVFVTAFSGCETVKSAKNLDLLLPSRPWALRATADLQLLSVEPREGRGSRLSGYLSFLSPSRTSGSARFAVSFAKKRKEKTGGGGGGEIGPPSPVLRHLRLSFHPLLHRCVSDYTGSYRGCKADKQSGR